MSGTIKPAELACGNVYSVEAWREDWGWSHNSTSLAMRHVIVDISTPRRFLSSLREIGYLNAGSVGRLTVQDDGDRSIEVLTKSRKEPIAVFVVYDDADKY